MVFSSATLFWSNPHADAALTVRSESDTPDLGLDDFTPVTRPGFAVADLAGSIALTDHLRLTGRMENLAGAHYEEVYGYGEPRRAVFVGFRWTD